VNEGNGDDDLRRRRLFTVFQRRRGLAEEDQTRLEE